MKMVETVLCCVCWLILGLWSSIFVSPAPLDNRDHLHTAEESIGKFWHVSDLHLDPTYHLTDDHTKVCFSSKGFPAKSPGFFGDFMCDSPYQLIQSAFQHMKDVDQQPTFMIWTGDSPPHVPAKELSTEIVIDIISNMTHTIQEFFPNLQVFPALGNHDYWPQDQLPVSTNTIYQAVAELWKPWLTTEALSTLSTGGFYSQIVKPNLRLISLNTILYYSPNHATENMTDPAGQFEWLEGTLDTSQQANEKVYIIAHVPVGYLPFARDITAVREHLGAKHKRFSLAFREAAMFDSDDDSPQLSAQALAALQEFYLEQQQKETSVVDKFSVGAIEEDWQLSQFWYSKETAERLAKEVISAAGKGGKIACISAPSIYQKLKELQNEDFSAFVLEYDRRFSVYGDEFVFYDYKNPLNLPEHFEPNSFDIVVADPPYLSEECLSKTAQTVKFLTKGKILLCTGAVMEEQAAKLLGLRVCKFIPKHNRSLANEFRCYVNYESSLDS